MTSLEGKYVRANGTDIYYIEAGQGEPLLLLHGGLMSTSPIWDGFPGAWVAHMTTFAQHFRVIAPDARGYGRTVDRGDGSILLSTFAEDIVALIHALGLEQPMICGFSEGGMIATIVGIQHPEAVRAIVNDAGYDVFNPNAPSFAMTRQILGGSPDATKADPAAAERSFGSSEEMSTLFALMQADHDGAQGPGYWKTLITKTFERWTQPPGYTFNDFDKITAPTLLLVGDQDHFCSPEEGVAAYRMLHAGELAVVPGTGHWISPLKVQIAIDFLGRHASPPPDAASV